MSLCYRYFSEFGQTIVRLMKNKVYVVLITSGTINLMGVVGGISFLPKYLAAQYSQPLWKSNIIMGKVDILLKCQTVQRYRVTFCCEIILRLIILLTGSLTSRSQMVR